MIIKVKFGECLRLLMLALNMSNNRLSKGINVDASLLSRWLHEQRIPSYNSNHIENIAVFLSENILNSLQEKSLNDSITNVYPNINVTLNTKNRIRKALLESQGYSLENKKEHPITKESSIKSNEIINLSQKDSIIIGGKEIFSAMISLIEKATNEKLKDNNIIYISFNGNLNVVKFHKIFIIWRDVVLKALLQGYTVKFLFSLNNNQNETLNFINFAKPLIETGAFLIYYHKFYDTSNLGSEVTIIPGIGALSSISACQDSEIASAFYINNQIGIDILCENFNASLLSSSKPLIDYYTSDKNLLYNYSLAESEESSGNRYLLKDHVNLLNISNTLANKLFEKLQFTDNELNKKIELHNSRLNSFLFNLQYCEHYDVYTLASIQNVIKSKQLSFIFHNVVNTVDLDIEDIIMLIQNMIYIIKTYDNYKFALINEAHYQFENHICFSVIIKEKHRVHINLSKFSISIDEPMIINAFEEYYKKTWEQISPIDKNKEENIKWFQLQIEILEKQIIT